MTARTPHDYHHPATPPPRYEPVAFAPGATVLFLGDSSTVADPGYVSIIAQSLARTRPDLNLRLLNAGRAGDTTRTAEARLAYDVLAHRPDWVVISLGLNDLNLLLGKDPAGVPPDEFADRYARIVQIVRDAGAQVIVLTTTVLGEEPQSRKNRLLKDYNAAIRTLAEQAGLRLVDVNRAFHNAYDRAATYKQEVALTSDGVHPNLQGYALIARTFMTELGLLQGSRGGGTPK